MPGSIAVNATSGLPVLPQMLCTKYSMAVEWRSRTNEMHGGELIVGPMVTTARHRFSVQARLTPTDMAALYAFWLANTCNAFFFYDCRASHLEVYDSTGASAVGRYTVRFATDTFVSELNICRGNLALDLIEVV